MRNSIRIGFIDMLTAFLCSSALLMVIIAYTKNESGNIAGNPRDFLYYKLTINDIDLKTEHFKKAKLRILLESPSGNVLETYLTPEGVQYRANGFMEINSKGDIDPDDFYIWGPVYQTVGENTYGKKEWVYNVYGTSPSLIVKDAGWKIGVLYYDHESIGSDVSNHSSGSDLEKTVERTLELTHEVKTLRDSVYRRVTHQISLGQYSNLKL